MNPSSSTRETSTLNKAKLDPPPSSTILHHPCPVPHNLDIDKLKDGQDVIGTHILAERASVSARVTAVRSELWTGCAAGE